MITMAEQVGVGNYKDLINNLKLANIKDQVNNLCLNYSKLASSDAVNNRENEGYEIYSSQYSLDLMYLREMCIAAQKIINECNDTMFLINNEAISHHLHSFGQ